VSRRITGADGQPITVEDGEWYVNTKARPRRTMQIWLSTDARRVYDCLELATMGFNQELAVTMSNGDRRPLTPADIEHQTGLGRQHVRRGLSELEEQGLAKREADDGGDLRRGHILIYSWAEPRPAPKPKFVAARGYKPDWFPPSWEPLMALVKRRRFKLLPEFVAARGYIEEGEQVARAYKHAEEVATRFLERFCARDESPAASLYESKGKELNNNNNTPPAPEPPKPERSVVVVVPETFSPDGNPTGQAPPPEVEVPKPTDPVVVVREALSRYGAPTEQAAAKLIAQCRASCPGCTIDQIVETIHSLGSGINGGTRNPVGMLLTQVPRIIKAQTAKPPPESEDERRQREYGEVLEHPDKFDAETVEYARAHRRGT
jgi:hypothetical protein